MRGGVSHPGTSQRLGRSDLPLQGRNLLPWSADTPYPPPCLPSVTNAPTPQRGKCLTLLSLNNNKPHNMLLTYVRLLCDFCIVSISKCLCGCCFSQPRDFLSPFLTAIFAYYDYPNAYVLRPRDFLSPFNCK